MHTALTLLLRTLKLWWADFFLLTLLNLAWLALQLPIVTA